MEDDPERFGRTAPLIDERDVGKTSRDPAHPAGSDRGGETQIVSLLEEIAVVSKRRVATGRLRIATRTEFRQESADVVLERKVVDVTRVPVGRLIEDAPDVRTEGDTTIVPIVEERFVVVKQLFLKEELHIRHRNEQETFQHSVELRRQSAVVERFDSEGSIVGPGDETTLRPAVLAPS